MDLGFTSDLGRISAERVDSLLAIDGKWRDLEAKRAETERKKRKR